MNVRETPGWSRVYSRATENEIQKSSKVTDAKLRSEEVSERYEPFVYLMGDAWTGKSTLINHIRTQVASMAVAPTNTAAINIEWQTFYKNMSLWIDVTIYDLMDHTNDRWYLPNVNQKNYFECPLFIIDEISMIDAEKFDMMCLIHIYRSQRSNASKSMILEILREATKWNENIVRNIHSLAEEWMIIIPKILISWDFWQLPPVLKKDRRAYLDTLYPSPYAFDSFFWKVFWTKTYRLTHNYRQQNKSNEPAEARFVECLQEIKYARSNQDTIQFLNDKILMKSIYEKLDPKPLLLSTTNARVKVVNARNLQSIPWEQIHIKNKLMYYNWKTLKEEDKYILWQNKGGEYGYWKFIQEIKNSNKIQVEDVYLKEWCQIMVTGNDYKDGKYVNGQIWKFIRVVNGGKGILVELYNQLEDEWYECIIPETIQDISEQVYDKNSYRLKSVNIGNYKWIPVTLGYAITTHKSQGKSLPDVVIDPHDGMYEENQAYVALSRATSYKWLWLYRPIKLADLKYNKYILNWMSNEISKQDLAF